jgi:ParB family chromosome partitioning protein
MEETTVVSAPARVQQIPLDQIRPSKYQARNDFEEEGIKSLAESIQKEGLIQPVSVRKVGDAYELIAGERRLRAVKLLGWHDIDALVVEVVSEAAASAKALVENLQRKDLNPMEEAEAFARQAQLDPSYWTQEEVAKVAGRSRVYVTQSLGFLKLPPQVKEDVRRLTLTRSHALEIMRLPDADQQSKAGREAVKGDLSIKETRKLVDGMLRKTEKPKEGKPAKEPQEGFHLARKGGRLTISGNFPADTTTDALCEKLMAAFNSLPKDPSPPAGKGE